MQELNTYSPQALGSGGYDMTQGHTEESLALRWWENAPLLEAVKAAAGASILESKASAKQDRALFMALVDAWETVTGTRPIYSQGTLYLYDSGVGVWSSCPSPRAAATGNASYRALWDLLQGLPTAHTRRVNGADEPVLVNINPTQERRMDDEPARTHSIHRPDVFDYETPGLVLPTRGEDGRVVWRLWRPNEDGSVTHSAPTPHDYKRHYCWDASLGDEQIIEWDAEQPEVPLWDSYLWSMWGNDSVANDKMACIEEFLGASMCGVATLFQRFLVFEGPAGSNGKSLLCKFIAKHLFQSDQTCASSPDQWDPSGFGTIQLDNKLINIITELPEGKTLRSDRLKAVVSGDEMSANRKNMSHVTIKPIAGHIISCNKFPRLGDNSGGMSRRLIMFQFNKRFVGRQRRSEREIMGELHPVVPQIRLRCLFAAADLMARKEYTLSEEHRRELEGLQERSNAAAAFLAKCVEIWSPDRQGTLAAVAVAPPMVDQSKMFKAYLTYCRRANHRYTLSDREFYKEVENCGFQRTPPGPGHRKFLNCELVNEVDWDVPSFDYE